MVVVTGDQIMNIFNEAEANIIKDMQNGDVSKEAIKYAYNIVHELRNELAKQAKAL